jgi:hypothetical protein
VDFNVALTAFLQQQLPHAHAHPTSDTQYNVFKQIKICTTYNCYIGKKPLTCHIRAIPSGPAKGQKQLTPAHFDIALVIEDKWKFQESGGIAGKFHDTWNMTYLANAGLHPLRPVASTGAHYI